MKKPKEFRLREFFMCVSQSKPNEIFLDIGEEYLNAEELMLVIKKMQKYYEHLIKTKPTDTSGGGDAN
jgi:hypothetical protein